MSDEDHGAPSGRVSIPETETATAIVAQSAERSDDPADRWLIWLRWVAVLGMAATILAAQRFVDGLDVTSLMSVLLAIGASNLIWLTLVTRPLARRSDKTSEKAPSGRRFVEAQLVVDVISIALMLWFGGGLTNPFAVFLTFQIALAGLLTTPRATLAIAGLTIVAALALTTAPPLPPISPLVERIAIVAGLTSLSVIMAAFVAVYARRLSRLRDEGAQNEKLAVLGRLVGSMSHELNTPLATILLLSRDLEKFRADMPAEEVDEVVRGIVKEAERANDIVGLVRGHVTPDQSAEPVELGPFVEEIANQELDRVAFEGERRFSMQPDVTVPVMKRALVQVLANVIRNASEATLLGSKRRILVSVATREGRAEIAVEDRGPGFQPDILARLGEPFQTTKGGMGLGLYVSAQLARQMGATLVAETLKGGGARVVVAFELAKE
ncbi:MAG TPA: ATP-binding protein [Polyangiaceae bacterium]|nr:ATP-binding protein [Polyangiaceae bacterium]